MCASENTEQLQNNRMTQHNIMAYLQDIAASQFLCKGVL